MKWEEEKKVEKKAKNHINDVNFTSFNLSTSFNQAKNAKSYSQGSQVAGGQTARSLGHPRGGHAGTGVNYGPRPGSASSNPGSSGQQTATSQAPATTCSECVGSRRKFCAVEVIPLKHTTPSVLDCLL